MAKNSADVRPHHREIARFLLDKLGPPGTVSIYRTNEGTIPVPVGEFGPKRRRFCSTLGMCDRKMKLPEGNLEFAAVGTPSWVPNALASSIYWLRGRSCEEWPLVCEDVVRHNVESTYRHFAYLPSPFQLQTSAGAVRWLVGVPITDSDIASGTEILRGRILESYPDWLTKGLA